MNEIAITDGHIRFLDVSDGLLIKELLLLGLIVFSICRKY